MPSIDIKQFRFLHVDDFANYRAMLRSILQNMGVEHIDSAKDAAAALELLEENEYDVILCDYNLGEGQNGQQFLEEAIHRKLLPYGTIFIMVTAENTMDMVMAAVEYRPDAYLNKPFPKEILIRRLEKLIYKKAVFKDIYLAYNQQQYDLALKICDRQMAAHPKLALDIGKLKADIAITAGELEVAESLFDKALKVRPFEWAQYGKAKILFARKQYQDCEKILRELLTQNKNYIEAYDLLAQVYDAQNNTQKAQKILEEATKISPRAISRQQKLAKVARANNDFAIAERSFRSAIHLGKHSFLGKVDDYTDLGKLYLENQKTSKAVKVINDAKVRYRKDEKSLFQANIVDSMVQKELGNTEKARELFIQAIHNMPEDIQHLDKSVQDDLISISEALNEHEMAQSLKEDINNPQQGSKNREKYQYLLLNGKGMRLYEENKIKQSIPVFEEAATNLPDNISVNMNAAQAIIMYLRQERPANYQELKQKARAYLDISKRLDPGNEKYQKLELLYDELS